MKMRLTLPALVAAVSLWAFPPALAHEKHDHPEMQAAAPDPNTTCDNKPVIMVVNGLSLDRERMLAYGKAIADSGIYGKLRGYYLNGARPIAVFEGDVPPSYVTLMVRFPCLAHARAFWYSKTYQETILPLRLNPTAGTFTVTVYPAAAIPDYMAGKVESGDYLESFGPDSLVEVPQIETQ